MITTTFEAAFAILAIEFALLAPLIAFFSFRGARSVEAQTTSEATELVTKVADTEDARKLALETVFREKYQYEGDELDGAVDEFMQREKAFYNAVVGAVLGRGDSKISDINDELTKVVAPWISITPKNMVDAKSADAVAAEKVRLESELGETKDTLEKMISEYNRAFRIEATEGAAAEADAEPAAAVDVTPDDDGDIDYKTEELNDLDEVLDAIESNEPPPADSSIVNLDEDDDDVDAEFAVDVAETVAGDGDALEELDSLDELDEFDDDDIVAADAESAAVEPATDAEATAEGGDDEPVEETPADRAEKQMTADDLDELMESLDVESADETEPA